MAIEGLGEAVTGSMIARAVEPEAGESTDEREGKCLNCGAAMAGPYCHQCGQKGHVHRSLRGFGHDLLHSVFHFEGKIWRTLPMLAWRPGELTRRYIEGERARYVSPIALFLFSVFLMFAVFSTLGGPFGPISATMPPEARAEIEAEHQRMRNELAQLEAQRPQMVARGQDVRQVDARIDDLRQSLSMVLLAQQTTENGLDIRLTERPSNIEWFNKAYQKARENPSLLFYKLQTNAYKFSWALIPISVPFVALLFLWRRRYRAYDHVVFVTYSIAFMTLLVVALSLVRPVLRSGDFAMLVMTFVPPIHMYRQLKGAYGLSRLSALWRTFFLVIFTIMAAMIFFLLLLAMGVLG